jgi:hypothetical protein
VQIYPCKAEKEFPLSWTDINAHEGVYEPEGMPDYRFIVLISSQITANFLGSMAGASKVVACFYVNTAGGVMGAVIGHETRHFRKTNERLCVEIKKT